MDIEGALEFIRENHRAVLATRRQDGSPQLSPVIIGVDAEDRIEMSSTEGRAKVLNLRRDPACSLVVMVDRFFGSWVQVDGRAEVLSLPDAMEPLVEYYRRISGEHEDWDAFRRAQTEDRRCLVRITPERAGPGSA